MTKRLYYDHSDLQEFQSIVECVLAHSAEQPRPGVILRETAFYPASGGQLHDTGWIEFEAGDRLQVTEVAEQEDGRIIHYLDAPLRAATGARVRGVIDFERRRHHMQQHSGQHVLSATFIELYQMPTVSFHMGVEDCSIDLATPVLSTEQVIAAEKRANQVVFENRPLQIRSVSRAEAEKLGLRKLPPAEHDPLRLVEIHGFDVSACGGTHVAATGQIGAILLRKTEKVRQGMRVEFVCGARAICSVRRDYAALSESAALFSAQLWDMPNQVRKSLEDYKLMRKQRDEAIEQLAESWALADIKEQPEVGGRKLIVRCFPDHDVGFAKRFAQKAVRTGVPAIALAASTLDPASLVFAQSAGGTGDMGALLKQVLASLGGRGGGSRDFAQGGVPAGGDVEQLLRQAAATIEAGK
jgi:alanyl-tRNA synthetase